MHSSSPSRRHKQITEIPSLSQYLKSLPINIPEEIVTVINTLPSINQSFESNLETLSAYRAALGSEIHKNWIQLLNFSRKLIYQIDIVSGRKQKENLQAAEYMTKQRQKMENEIRELKNKLVTMTSLKDVQQSQAEEAMVEVETLRKQIGEIHKIVQKDMDKVMQYLIVLEKSQRTEVSNQIFSCLERLALSLNRLQDESHNSGNALNTMQQMIKAMARNNKTDAFTQLQQNQLESKAQAIFPMTKQKVSLQKISASSLNLTSHLNRQSTDLHIIDQLRTKEYDYPPQMVSKKNPQKAWVLPPTIVLFLENMAKDNENGKVLPWQYVKKLIYEIYSERINHRKQILGGLVGNAIPMDEFVVMLFLRKYNMRRLAQLKLLQFLISIKYYTKFWMKAETFAASLDIMRINPYFQINDTNVYKFDIYVQHFFFHVLAQFDKSELSEQEDGATYIELQNIKSKLKPLLSFCEQLNRSRLFAKLEKTVRVQEKVEYVDFDIAINLSVQQFFFYRKQNLAQMGRQFAKVNQQTEGYFSLKQIASVFQDFGEDYKKGEEVYGSKYPVSSGLQLCKLYLYAITSGKNAFSISSKDFLASCQRFGFDCPVPFLHDCNPSTKRKSRLQKSLSLSPKKTVYQGFSTIANQMDGNYRRVEADNPTASHAYRRMESVPTEPKQPKQNPYNKKIQIASHMFSQHFTILKQLSEYCKSFKTELGKETDTYILWNQFNNILQVLEKGCEFVKHPLKH